MLVVVADESRGNPTVHGCYSRRVMEEFRVVVLTDKVDITAMIVMGKWMVQQQQHTEHPHSDPGFQND